MGSADATGLVPETLGRYRVTGVLGQGADGLVLAGVSNDGEKIAIKLARGLDATGRERFEREVAACRRLEHPGIVRIRDAGSHGHDPWYAMDLVSGVSLADLITRNHAALPEDLPALIAVIDRGQAPTQPPARRRRLPPATAVGLIAALCRAIEHAHGRGLVHRDLKPENILMGLDGRPVICDFGLAGDLAGRSIKTVAGATMGTFGYAAPEWKHGTVDERADIYALGVILRELLTSMPPAVDPLPGTGTGAALRRRLRDLPRPLATIIHRASHPAPHRRYHSAAALLTDLEHWLAGEPILARRDPWPLRGLELVRAYPWTFGTLGLVLILLAGLAVRGQVLRRLEASRWSGTLIAYDLSDTRALGRLDQVSGTWVPVADGVRLGSDGEAVLALRERVAESLRLTVAVRLLPQDTSATAGLGAYLGASHADPASGYQFRIGSLGRDLAVLTRAGQLLWLGRLTAPAGDHVLELERDGTRLGVRWDQNEILSLEDPVPLYGGRAGVILDGTAATVATIRSLDLRGRSIPPLCPPGWLAERLVGTLAALPPHQRAPYWTVIETTLAEQAATAGDESGADAARRLLTAGLAAMHEVPESVLPANLGGRPAIAARLRALLDETPLARRDTAWHLRRVGILGAVWDPADRAGRGHLLTSLMTTAADWNPADRQRLLLWLLNRPDAASLALAQQWAFVQNVSAPLSWLLASRIASEAAWDGAARVQALHILDDPHGPGPGAWRTRTERLRTWTTRTVSSDPDLAWRASFLTDGPPAGSLVRRRLRDLILGIDTTARFDPELVSEPDLPASDHILADGLAKGDLLPGIQVWEVRALANPSVIATCQACLEGRAPLADLARAAAEAGWDPGHLPWGRLAACAVLLQPQDAGLRQTLDLAMSHTLVEILGLAATLRWLDGRGPSAALMAECGSDLAAALGSLARGAQVAPVPRTHPSYPLLSLLIAIRLAQDGHPTEARRLAETLQSASRLWPESLAAQVLIERLR